NAPQGWELLQISAVGMIFVALNQTLTGSLQGLGKVSVPARALLFGVAAKVILNLILIRIPAINIYGAPIASVVCYLIASSICFFTLKKELSLQAPCGKYLWKPLACTAVMGASAAAGYQMVYFVLPFNGIAVLLTVFCASMLYFVLVLKSRILSAEEIAQLPVGNGIKHRLRSFGENP
ncbi:MAG: polysaccharide biosynthesis C-terminal domain-containing protein, partial [Peptococcaceae bacterium]